MWYNSIMSELFKFHIDSYDFQGAVDYAKSLNGHVVTINPEMIEYALKNDDFANIINNAQLVIPDGIGVEIGLKINGYNVKRIAGIDFAYEMLKHSESVALIGAKPHVAEMAVKNLSSQIQNLNVVYISDGYFDDDEKVINEVVNTLPRLVLVALGSPKQEEFISKLKLHLPNSLLIGVGGSFDVWSGNVERAPMLFRKLGLEWLYRTIKEPQRFKRIFPTLPLFLLKVIKEKYVK